MQTREEQIIAQMHVEDLSQQTRLHPHPVWDRASKRVYFNSSDDGILRMWAIDLET